MNFRFKTTIAVILLAAILFSCEREKSEDKQPEIIVQSLSSTYPPSNPEQNP